MDVIVDFSEEEQEIAEEYAIKQGIALEQAIKIVFFEKIEEEFDLAVAEEACTEYEQGGKVSRPIGKLWEELNL